MFFFVDFSFLSHHMYFVDLVIISLFYALQIYNFPALIFLHLWNIIFFCSKSKFKSNGNYLMSFYYFSLPMMFQMFAQFYILMCAALFTPLELIGLPTFIVLQNFFSCHRNFLWASRNTGFCHETHVTDSFLPNLELFCVSQHYVHNTIEFFPSMCPFHP